MNKEVFDLLQQAQEARILYNLGHITREEAKIGIDPYIDLYNKKAKEIAKKYGMRPKLISFITFVRQ